MDETKILELLKKAMSDRPKERRRNQITYNFNFYGDKLDVSAVASARLLARALTPPQDPELPPPAAPKAKAV
jgi:hypothetical protein